MLLVHTGGTLGMDPGVSYHLDANGKPVLAAGTGGTYAGALRPGACPLSSKMLPRLCKCTHLHLGSLTLNPLGAGTMLKSLLKACARMNMMLRSCWKVGGQAAFQTAPTISTI